MLAKKKGGGGGIFVIRNNICGIYKVWALKKTNSEGGGWTRYTKQAEPCRNVL